MEYILLALAMIALLLLKGFFSGSEIALVNTDKIRLRYLARQGNRGAGLLLKMSRNPERMLSTTLVGTNISTVALSTLATMLMIRFFGGLGDLYAFAVFTPILLILGEIVPKSVYQQKSEDLATRIIYPIRAAYFLFYPIILLFSGVARMAVWALGGGKSSSGAFITREQLRMILETTERTSDLASFRHGRIRRAVRFADTPVGEMMTPLSAVDVVDVDADLRELARTRRTTRPLPVYEGNAANIVGVLRLDARRLLEDPGLLNRQVREVMQNPHYLAPVQRVADALRDLSARDDHTGVVVNEFGAAVGILTVEDAFGEVVGEVDLGYGKAERPRRVKKSAEVIDDGVYLMDAQMPISDAVEILGLPLESPEALTIGGLVIQHLHRIPQPGDQVRLAGYRFTVVEASERRIDKLQVEAEL